MWPPNCLDIQHLNFDIICQNKFEYPEDVMPLFLSNNYMAKYIYVNKIVQEYVSYCWNALKLIPTTYLLFCLSSFEAQIERHQTMEITYIFS